MLNKTPRQDTIPLLIILPYAGGSASAFYKWSSYLKDTATVQAIEYAGHGTRFRVPLPNDFQAFVQDALLQVESIIHKTDSSFWLFGHSLGGVVAAYISCVLHQKYGVRLKGVILSSCLPPACLVKRNHRLSSDSEIIEYLCVERNVSRQLVCSHEFITYILPAIRNDFQILNEFSPVRLEELPSPVFCIWGNMDYGIRREDMDGWQLHVKEPGWGVLPNVQVRIH